MYEVKALLGIVAAVFNYDRESLGRSGSFRRANEQTLIKLISEGQVSLSLPQTSMHSPTPIHR